MARIRKRNNTAISAPIDATPERLAKAARDIEQSSNRARSENVTRLFDGWPLKLMLSRKVISQIQFDAGERYYEHHYQAGLEPHVSPDYGATGGGRNSWDHSHMAASERAAWHRQKVRAANERLGPGLVRYIGLILIDEVPAGEAARRITGRNNEAACRAVGTEMLKEALKILIDHWGMEPKRRRA